MDHIQVGNVGFLLFPFCEDKEKNSALINSCEDNLNSAFNGDKEDRTAFVSIKKNILIFKKIY